MGYTSFAAAVRDAVDGEQLDMFAMMMKGSAQSTWKMDQQALG